MSSKSGSKPKVRKTPVVDGVGRYATYIRRIFKQVSAELKLDMHISGQSLIVVDQMVHHTLQKVMESANRLRLIAKAKTLSGKHIQGAMNLMRQSAPDPKGDIQSQLINAAVRANNAYKTKASGNGDKVEVVAGITMSVSRVRREMKVFSEGCSCRFAASAAIYMAGMLDELVHEVLELSTKAAADNKRKTVSTVHIKLAIRNDPELDLLFERFVFTSGVQPHIHKAILLTKKKGGLKSNPKRKSKSAAAKKPKRKSKKAAPKK